MTGVRLYGVIDCAQDPSLFELVKALGPGRGTCLFEGSLAPRVTAVSPHVVELTPTDPLSRAWRGEGWGRNWGLLMSSAAPLVQIRRRLRHFTQARLPDGSGPVLFRFWDPRVFRTYLPLVAEEDLAAWFKDIDRYTVEDKDGGGSLRFALDGSQLVVTPGARPRA